MRVSAIPSPRWQRARVRFLRTKSSRLEPLNLPDAGFETKDLLRPKRAATIPFPGGEGQGEGGLPSLQFVPALCSRRFMGRGFPDRRSPAVFPARVLPALRPLLAGPVALRSSVVSCFGSSLSQNPRWLGSGGEGIEISLATTKIGGTVHCHSPAALNRSAGCLSALLEEPPVVPSAAKVSAWVTVGRAASGRTAVAAA